jgi:hypothetical protein
VINYFKIFQNLKETVKKGIDAHDEIRRRISSGGACYYSVQHGTKKDEISKQFRMIHNGEHCSLCRSPYW